MTHSDEAARKLRKVRTIATLLLVTAAVVFVLASLNVARYPWLAYVKAFAEAAMVGALADWFAVVALFRHPLGLPIPHTAILPRNQARIAKSLGQFIENNFLEQKAIAKKVYYLEPSRKFLDWLANIEHQALVAPFVVKQIPTLMQAIKPEQMSLFLGQLLKQQYDGKSLGHTLSQMLRMVQSYGYHQIFFIGLLEQIRAWLRHEETRQLLEDNINSWAAKVKKDNPSSWDKLVAAFKGSAVDMVDGWVARKVLDWADNYCEEVINDDSHAMRAGVERKMNQLIWALEFSPIMHKRLNQAKDGLINSDAVQQFIQHSWLSLQNWSASDAVKNDSMLMQQVLKMMNQMLIQGAAQPEVLRRFDAQISLWVREAVGQYKSKVADYVAEKVKSWDSQELVQKLELSVGKDLQYIRINGTLVGGLVGLVIYVVSGWLV